MIIIPIPVNEQEMQRLLGVYWTPERVQAAYEIFCDKLIEYRADRGVQLLTPREFAEEFIRIGTYSRINRGNFLKGD